MREMVTLSMIKRIKKSGLQEPQKLKISNAVKCQD